MPRLRAACPDDLPRIHVVRHGTVENRLSNPALVTEAEVLWYMNRAIFLVSEDKDGIQGFCCANPLSSYIWALFVLDERHGVGHGSALMDEVEGRLRALGHRQVYLTTDHGTRAETWYQRRGYRVTGTSFGGEAVLVKAL
ncbi:NAT_SF domain containing protein [Rhabdaerophilaceae bacterium]